MGHTADRGNDWNPAVWQKKGGRFYSARLSFVSLCRLDRGWIIVIDHLDTESHGPPVCCAGGQTQFQCFPSRNGG